MLSQSLTARWNGISRSNSPTLSFVANANVVAHCGTVPYFMDSSFDTMEIDPIALAEYLSTTDEPNSDRLRKHYTTRRITSIVLMHDLWSQVDIASLVEVAAESQGIFP